MRLSNALSEKLMDVRLRDKLVTEGKLSNNQVSEYLNNLPDDKANLTYVEDFQTGEESLNNKS